MKYDVEGFEEILRIRFTPDQLKLMKRILRKDPETYGSISHFVRASTIKRMREEKQRLKV